MEYEEWKKKFANGMEKSTMDDLLASIDLLADRVWYEEMRERERRLRYELAGAKGAERERLAREVERVVEEIRRWPERRPRAVFRSDAYAMAREIMGLNPTRVVLLGR